MKGAYASQHSSCFNTAGHSCLNLPSATRPLAKRKSLTSTAYIDVDHISTSLLFTAARPCLSCILCDASKRGKPGLWGTCAGWPLPAAPAALPPPHCDPSSRPGSAAAAGAPPRHAALPDCRAWPVSVHTTRSWQSAAPAATPHSSASRQTQEQRSLGDTNELVAWELLVHMAPTLHTHWLTMLPLALTGMATCCMYQVLKRRADVADAQCDGACA